MTRERDGSCERYARRRRVAARDAVVNSFGRSPSFLLNTKPAARFPAFDESQRPGTLQRLGDWD